MNVAAATKVCQCLPLPHHIRVCVQMDDLNGFFYGIVIVIAGEHLFNDRRPFQASALEHEL